LLFAKEPHVAFTNNRAERDLRMSKVKRNYSPPSRRASLALRCVLTETEIPS
jgi:hypothetical protein